MHTSEQDKVSLTWTRSSLHIYHGSLSILKLSDALQTGWDDSEQGGTMDRGREPAETLFFPLRQTTWSWLVGSLQCTIQQMVHMTTLWKAMRTGRRRLSLCWLLIWLTFSWCEGKQCKPQLHSCVTLYVDMKPSCSTSHILLLWSH